MAPYKHFAVIAQVAEQPTLNRQVWGIMAL